MQKQQAGPEIAPADPFGEMWNIVTAYRTSQLARCAALYSFPEHLAAGPKTARDIATAESLDTDATFRALRACASIGLTTTTDGRHFSGTPLLDTLRADVTGSLRGLALMLATPGHWLPWGLLPEALKEGKRQTESALGCNLWDWFAKTPEENAYFSAAMAGMMKAVGEQAARTIDTSDVDLAVDVGGASGQQLHELMAINPQLRGIVLDTASIVPDAEAEISRLGLGARSTALAGDFFDSVPEADLYLLRYVLHDWDDESGVAILSNCRAAMRDGARVVVLEMTVKETGDTSMATFQDLNMLTMFGGRERTVEEFAELFARAGLRLSKVTHTATPMTVIEAVAE